MKKLILGLMTALTTLTACNSGFQHGHTDNGKGTPYLCSRLYVASR